MELVFLAIQLLMNLKVCCKISFKIKIYGFRQSCISGVALECVVMSTSSINQKVFTKNVNKCVLKTKYYAKQYVFVLCVAKK